MPARVIAWLEHPVVKWLLPVPLLIALAPLVYWFFAPTWRRIEAEALAWRQELAATGRIDLRPAVTLVLGAVILTMQEYYGPLRFFEAHIRPLLGAALGTAWDPQARAQLATYAELYGRLWWGFTRIGGYLLPFAVWKLMFRGDRLRDMGMKLAGFRQHAWIYALFVVVMVPIMLLVARQPDFGAYYPIYSQAGRSWLDFVVWEAVYFGQFVGLELFFRGWWLRGTRIFGTGAIFSMVVPYCMIHYGKPYLEASAAIVAGAVLGSLALKTGSVWAGVLVHETVAILMDVLALERKGQLPSALTAGSAQHLHFPYWRWVIWIVWLAALAILVASAVRAWPALRARFSRAR